MPSQDLTFAMYPLDAVEKRWGRGEDGEFVKALADKVIDHFKVY
ncbi:MULTISPECIES: hypothetical protein [unclassified Paenarthrobacter]|nr:MULTISPECIES: hypothetical protein [unclassified Paenarthrobacter]